MAPDTASSSMSSDTGHTAQQGATNHMVPSIMVEKAEEAEEHAPKSVLLNIPTELQLKIFKLLDRASSTCLGLTNKRFYQIHWELHGKVSLITYCILPPERDSGFHLFELLNHWAGPELVIGETCKTFITLEEYRSCYPPYLDNLTNVEGASSRKNQPGILRNIGNAIPPRVVACMYKVMTTALARHDAEREKGSYYHRGLFIELAVDSDSYLTSW